MKKIILVVDDDDQLRDMLQQTLTQNGYTVVTASNGAKALLAFEQNPPDLVLTDLMMPEKEGIETILELLRRRPQTKIIAMSGGSRCGPAPFLEIARRVGALYTLAKPFSHDELALAINNVLGRGVMAGSSRGAPNCSRRDSSQAGKGQHLPSTD
jgi:DNA-binding response OmpR family regulator